MIGPYRLVEQLGQGGMGVVWRAKREDDLSMGAAVKLIKRAAATPGMRVRFKRERQMLADLRHPHIAQILDAGDTEDGLPYLIMEFIEGRNLDVWALQDKTGPAPNPEPVCQIDQGRRLRPPQRGHPPRHQTRQRHGLRRR